MELSNKFVHAGGEIFRLPAISSITQIAFFVSSSTPYHDDAALSVRVHVDHDPTGFIAITKNSRAVEQFHTNLLGVLGGMEDADTSLIKSIDEAYQEALRQKDLLVKLGEEKRVNAEAHGLQAGETMHLSWWRRWLKAIKCYLNQLL